MKSDRKRLKVEKADLVNQMQQLYATLESREEQLRDFIRNYEQHRKVRTLMRRFLLKFRLTELLLFLQPSIDHKLELTFPNFASLKFSFLSRNANSAVMNFIQISSPAEFCAWKWSVSLCYRRVRMQWRCWPKRKTCWRGRSGTCGGRPRRPRSTRECCAPSSTSRKTASRSWRLSWPWWDRSTDTGTPSDAFINMDYSSITMTIFK